MRKFYIFALVATIFAACTTDKTQDVQLADAPETLTVSFEGGDDNTRVQLNEAGKTVWTKDDLVSVFYRSNANQQWKFYGETGERSAELRRVDAGSATETIRRVVVVYPYNENFYINTETYNVQASLPATQHYLADSYGLDGNLMISSGEYNNISLKSVCGWLKLQLVGNGEKVQSITLKGNNGEQVAGELYINSADATAILSSDKGSGDDGETGGAGGGLVFEDTILKEVTLDCGDGVTLGTEATAFYIALPPQTFEKGITVEIADTSGYKMTQSTDKSLAIERNTIQPMAAVEYEMDVPLNEIWYNATEKVEPYDPDEFGATITSNVWDSDSGKGVITFLANVTKIGYHAFYKCEKLKTITIPDSVTSIGQDAFYLCVSLTSVTIPDSVTDIGRFAFYKCSSLTSVTIPDSVTKIGENAFSYCTSLTAFYGKFATTDNRCLIVNGTLNAFAIGCGATSYTIPDSVTKIGVYAFNKCSSLTSITIPDSVTSIEWYAFADCTSLTSVNIPDSVTKIGEGAFGSCESLTSVTIPDSVTQIRSSAFNKCTSLTSVTIPDSITSIGEGAFKRCTSLTSVTIPDSVTSIGSSAFENCTSLKEVYCKPTTPPAGGNYMFSNNASDRKIYVPASADDSIINAYKKAYGWRGNADYIFEYDFSAQQ